MATSLAPTRQTALDIAPTPVRAQGPVLWTQPGELAAYQTQLPEAETTDKIVLAVWTQDGSQRAAVATGQHRLARALLEGEIVPYRIHQGSLPGYVGVPYCDPHAHVALKFSPGPADSRPMPRPKRLYRLALIAACMGALASGLTAAGAFNDPESASEAIIPVTRTAEPLTTSKAVTEPAAAPAKQVKAATPATKEPQVAVVAPKVAAKEPQIAKLREQGLPVGCAQPQLLARSQQGAGVYSQPGEQGKRLADLPGGSRYFGNEIWMWARTVRNGYGLVQIPFDPAGRSGWVRLDGLAQQTTRQLIQVDLSERSMQVWKGCTKLWQASVAVGASGSPTPVGHYTITDPTPVPAGQPQFGTYAYGLSGVQPNLPSGWGGGNQLALHGTNDPGSIGSAASAGCLRMSDATMSRLRESAQPGTLVVVQA